jgi:hypothetical protein
VGGRSRKSEPVFGAGVKALAAGEGAPSGTGSSRRATGIVDVTDVPLALGGAGTVAEGATDTWVHDANGEPLLVVTSEMTEGLTQVLKPILADVKSLLGDRRVLVIFNRGGFSGQGTDQRTVRGFKIAHAELRARLAEAEAEVAGLQTEREQLPRPIPAAGLKTLKTEKKLIADTIKMTAYQVETRLLGMLNGVYCRNEDEGRTLLQAGFQSTARMEVREAELYVELVPQSSPHRTKAIAELCTKRNALGTKFPGTGLRLQLAIRPHQPLKNP